MNNALYYCQQKIAPPGSVWYYCLRNINPLKANLALAILTLAQEWKHIAFSNHELQIVEAKFAFWQQELQAIYEGKATHPASQWFYQNKGCEVISCQSLLQSLLAYRELLSPVLYQTEAEWSNQALFKYHELRLIYTIFDEQKNIPKEWQDRLIEAVLIADGVIDLKKLLAAGICPFAVTDLVAEHIDIDVLQQMKETPELKRVLHKQVNKALTNFEQLTTMLSKDQKKAQKLLLRYCKLQMVLLNEIVKADFPVLHSQIILTPLRKLWLTTFL